MPLLTPTHPADFELLAAVLLDQANVQYLYRKTLLSHLVVMGGASLTPAPSGRQPHRFAVEPIHAWLTKDAGDAGQAALQQRIQQLLAMPDVTVVGFAQDAPDGSLVLSLFSREHQGVRQCVRKHTARGYTFVGGELVLARRMAATETRDPR